MTDFQMIDISGENESPVWVRVGVIDAVYSLGDGKGGAIVRVGGCGLSTERSVDEVMRQIIQAVAI